MSVVEKEKKCAAKRFWSHGNTWWVFSLLCSLPATPHVTWGLVEIPLQCSFPKWQTHYPGCRQVLVGAVSKHILPSLAKVSIVDTGDSRVAQPCAVLRAGWETKSPLQVWDDWWICLEDAWPRCGWASGNGSEVFVFVIVSSKWQLEKCNSARWS